MGCRVQIEYERERAGFVVMSSGPRALDLGSRLGFRVKGLGFKVKGVWFRVYGLGCMVQGLGFRV